LEGFESGVDSTQSPEKSGGIEGRRVSRASFLTAQLTEVGEWEHRTLMRMTEPRPLDKPTARITGALRPNPHGSGVDRDGEHRRKSSRLARTPSTSRRREVGAKVGVEEG
jgi:hypothetical protein